MRKRNVKQWYRHGDWWRRLRLNRRYKDVLFRRLFREEQDLLDLYNALNGSAYKDPGELEVVTMEDVIFMKMKNDLYGKGRIGLPTPVYIVFYNGSGMQTDRLVLYLSDAYQTGRGSGCLECSCEVININRGHNQGLLEKCHRLWEYSELTGEVEENIVKGMSREGAVHTAIESCIERGILREMLLAEKGEVVHMLLTEYDEKRHLRNTFEEGRKEGLEEGREEKLRELVHKKLSRGKSLIEIAEELEEEISVIEQMIKR